MAKKKTAPKIEVLELDYSLAELPSSQHRAGLAGLVLGAFGDSYAPCCFC